MDDAVTKTPSDIGALRKKVYADYTRNEEVRRVMDAHRLKNARYLDAEEKLDADLSIIIEKADYDWENFFGRLFRNCSTRVKQGISIEHKLFMKVWNTELAQAKVREMARDEDATGLLNWVQVAELYETIHDIVGGRVCVAFCDHIHMCVGLLKADLESRGYKMDVGILSKDYTEGKKDGYFGFHFYVGIPKLTNGAVDGFQTAEIQVQSVIGHAWSDIAHDLVYKQFDSPSGKCLDEKTSSKIKSLSVVLNESDRQFCDIRERMSDIRGYGI